MVPLSSWPFAADCSTQPTRTQRDLALSYRSEDSGFFFNTLTGYALTDQVITNMKGWLARSEPIVLVIEVPDEVDGFWAAYGVPEKQNCTLDLPSQGSSSGLHAIAMVGYDDDIANTHKSGFKIVNSWGTGWGCGGFAYLTYDWLKENAVQATWMQDRRTGGHNTRDFTIFNDGKATLAINSISKLGGASRPAEGCPRRCP